MRLHTAALHILWAALTKSIPGLEIIGSEMGLEHSRFDVRADRSLLIERLNDIEALANRIVEEDRPVRVRVLGRVEAERLLRGYGEDPSQLPKGGEIRIVEIPGWDVAACLGTHVRNTREVGYIKILRRTSKGRGIDRIYFTVINNR